MNEAEIKSMTEDEVWEYIRDCIATCKVLIDSQSPKAGAVHDSYMADIALLYKLGRITEDEYNELNDEAILRFDS